MAATWTHLHDLSYLFLALAHGADGHLAKEEKTVIVEKLLQREPELLREGVRDLLNQVAKVYQQDRREKSKRRLESTIRKLKAKLEEEELREVYQDLVDLAQADGVILDGEWSFIDELKAAWGMLQA